MSEEIIGGTWIFVLLLSLLLTLALDYFICSRKLRELNDKITKNPNYLKNSNTRELCKTILSTIGYGFVFTIIEQRKLKKALDKYNKK